MESPRKLVSVLLKINQIGYDPLKIIRELLTFHAAVVKRVDPEKISYNRAASALMDGIDTSDKLIDARKQLMIHGCKYKW